jgi:hypothetical protein
MILKNLISPDRLALHSRIIKRACNWGWFPNESLQKRSFLHGYVIADSLVKLLHGPAFPDLKVREVPAGCFYGLERLLEVILDTRYGFLSKAIVELASGPGEFQDAFRELDRAME